MKSLLQIDNAGGGVHPFFLKIEDCLVFAIGAGSQPLQNKTSKWFDSANILQVFKSVFFPFKTL